MSLKPASVHCGCKLRCRFGETSRPVSNSPQPVSSSAPRHSGTPLHFWATLRHCPSAQANWSGRHRGAATAAAGRVSRGHRLTGGHRSHRRSQTVTNGHMKVTESTDGHKKVTEGTDGHRMVEYGHIRSHAVTYGHRRVTYGHMRSQEGHIRSQMVKDGHIRSHRSHTVTGESYQCGLTIRHRSVTDQSQLADKAQMDPRVTNGSQMSHRRS